MIPLPHQYTLKRKDYTCLKQWHESHKQNYQAPLPKQSSSAKQHKQQHFRYTFTRIHLSNNYINQNIHNLNKISHIILIACLLDEVNGYYLNKPFQRKIQAVFKIQENGIVFGEEMMYYFYLLQKAKHKFLCVQMQIVTSNGFLFKLGTIKEDLTPSKFKLVIFNQMAMDQNEQVMNKDLKELLNRKNISPKAKPSEHLEIGYIEVILSIEQVPSISLYLPPKTIIDHNQSIPPCQVNLKKKVKQVEITPLVVTKVIVRQITLKVQNARQIIKHLEKNDPFGLGHHREQVQMNVDGFQLTMGNHNSWKFLQQKNVYQLEQQTYSGSDLYLSSKTLNNLQLPYYDNEKTLLLCLLTIKITYKLKGQYISQDKSFQLLLGWLPIMVNLPEKETKMDMMMINDVRFLGVEEMFEGVCCHIMSAFEHANFEKYKKKPEDKQIKTYDKLLIEQAEMPNIIQRRIQKAMKTRLTTKQTIGASQFQNKLQIVDNKLEEMKDKACFYFQEMDKGRMLFIQGNHIGVNSIIEEEEEVVMEEGKLQKEDDQYTADDFFNKYLTIKVSPRSLIPLYTPSRNTIPTTLNLTIHLMRHTLTYSCQLQTSQPNYGIPVILATSKSEQQIKVQVNTANEMTEIKSSRMVVVVKDSDGKAYCKGCMDVGGIMRKGKESKVEKVRMVSLEGDGEDVLAVLLCELSPSVHPKNPHKTIMSSTPTSLLPKLSTYDRQKLRINNFQNRHQQIHSTIGQLKEQTHNNYVANVVSSEYGFDGQIQYEFGKDCFWHAQFINQNSSENNVFVFRLDNPYVQIVTQQKQYLEIIQKNNLYLSNFHKIDYYYSTSSTPAYYQTKLNFNQNIGLLLKINVNQYNPNKTLDKLQLKIQRNTMHVKNFRIKCKLMQPLVYDYWQRFQIDKDLKLAEGVIKEYGNMHVLNKMVKYNSKTNTIESHQTNKITLLLKTQKQPFRIIKYDLNIVDGEEVEVQAGQPYLKTLNISQQLYLPKIMILRCAQSEVTIQQKVKFIGNVQDDLIIQCLRPYKGKDVIVFCSDLDGRIVYQYLYRLTTKETNLTPIKVSNLPGQPFQLPISNPYPITCHFKLLSSDPLLEIEQTEITINGYSFKAISGIIKGSIKDTSKLKESSSFIYVIDGRGVSSGGFQIKKVAYSEAYNSRRPSHQLYF